MTPEREPVERGREVGEVLATGRGSRRYARRKWMVLGGLLLVLGAGYALRESGLMARALGGEPELDVVTKTVVEEWQRARIGGLADLVLPEKREAFRTRLETIATKRGWTSGFPPVQIWGSRVLIHSEGEPREGSSTLGFGQGAEAAMTWRFDADRGRWFMTSFRITPPAVEPRVEAFQEAWGGSQPEALAPFFREGTAEVLAASIESAAVESGWADGYPALGAATVSAAQGEGTAEAAFPCGGGELLVQWVYRESDDEWFVADIRVL